MAIDTEVTPRLPTEPIDRTQAAEPDDFLKAYQAQSWQAQSDLATRPRAEGRMSDLPRHKPKREEAEPAAFLLGGLLLGGAIPPPSLRNSAAGEGGKVTRVAASAARPAQQPGADGAATPGAVTDVVSIAPAPQPLRIRAQQAAWPAGQFVPLPPSLSRYPAEGREAEAPARVRSPVLVTIAAGALAPAGDGTVRYHFKTWPGQPSVDLHFAPALGPGRGMVVSSADPRVRRAMLQQAGTLAETLTLRFVPCEDGPAGPARDGESHQRDGREEA